MDLEQQIVTITACRREGRDLSTAATRLKMSAEEVATFERNMILEFWGKLKSHGSVKKAAESLQWPIWATYYLNRTYELSKAKKVKRPLFKVVLEKQNGERAGIIRPAEFKARVRMRELKVANKRKRYNEQMREESSMNMNNIQEARAAFLSLLNQTSQMDESEIYTRRFFASSTFTKRLSQEKVRRIFDAYFDSVREGRSLEFTKMGKIAGVSYVSVSYVLRKAGLETGKRMIREFNEEQLNAIQSTAMPSLDICAFTDYNSSKKFDAIRSKHPTGRIKRFWHPDKRDEILTYRLASEIYEAQDASFNMDEIVQLTNKSPDLVSYALQNRSEIEGPIVSFLQAFYSAPGHGNPYRTATMKTGRVPQVRFKKVVK